MAKCRLSIILVLVTENLLATWDLEFNDLWKAGGKLVENGTVS